MQTQLLVNNTPRLDAARAIPVAADYVAVDRHLFWHAYEAATTLWTAPLGGPVTMVNRGIESLSGFAPEHVRAAETNIWIERAHPEDRERMAQACGAGLASGETIELEYRWQRKDGTWIWLRSRTAVRFTLNGPVVDGAMSDVTDRRSLEEEVQKLQRLEILAHLAGGVAHDFRNLLSIIRGSADLLLPALQPGSPEHAGVTAIVDAAARGADLTSQILGFNRRHTSPPARIDINTVVEGMRRMLALIGEDVELTFEPATEGCHVVADQVQLEQVIANLVLNARDAMPQGGRIALHTAIVDAPAGGATRQYCQLTITDNGAGMTEETRLRAFEAGFTTKTTGTGLGLATCRRIIRDHSGVIELNSAPGDGTKVTVRLPLTPGEPAAAEAPKTPGVRPAGAGETILVIEDDAFVLDLVSRMLDKRGYTVLRAADGPEAVAQLERHAETIDLILSDVIIPGTNGPVIVREIARMAPQARVLFMSGHSARALISKGVLQAPNHFIQKPFSLDGLTDKVREVLDA